MHTVELLEQAIDVAVRLGYNVRQEWLAGSGGGGCEVKGRRLLFVDLDLDPAEQLEQVLDAIRLVPNLAAVSMPRELGELLNVRKSA